MSWLFGSSSTSSSKPSTGAATGLQQQRLKQVETLRTLHHNVTEVQRDVEYRVTFSVGGSTCFLNITLPPQFPRDKPSVRVSPPLRHPWVNDQMLVIGSPALNSFYMHSSLGKAIQEVVREFCEHPPQFNSPQSVQQQTNANSFQLPAAYSFPAPYQPYTPFPSMTSSMPTSTDGFSSSRAQFSQASMAGSMGILSSSSSSSQNMGSSNVAQEPSSSFPELHPLSLERLKELNDNPEALEEFISQLESTKKLQLERDESFNKNVEIANYNLSLQPKLESCKDAILQKYSELSDLKREFAEKSQKQHELTEMYKLSSVHVQMEVATVEADQESEAIAEDFLAKNISTEEFVKSFMEKRKLCHCRRAKEEKLQNLHTRY